MNISMKTSRPTPERTSPVPYDRPYALDLHTLGGYGEVLLANLGTDLLGLAILPEVGGH